MKHVITYIPSDEINCCQVCKIYNLTKYNKIQLMIKRCKQLLVKSNNPDLNNIIKNTKADQIICFGYKDFEFPTLLTSEEKKFITAHWFGNQFKVGIFFINNSSALFTNSDDQMWIEKFSHWVGFSDTFQPFVDYEDSVSLQQQMYKEVLKEIVNKKTGSDISDTLKKIYDKYIEKFSLLCHDEKTDSDKLVNTMHVLQMNRESIVYGK